MEYILVETCIVKDAMEEKKIGDNSFIKYIAL